MPDSPPPAAERHFPCKQCGADLRFAPGQDALVCPYCSTLNKIEASAVTIEEVDFEKTLSELASGAETEEKITVKCQQCAAESTLPANTSAGKCPFCGTAIVAEAKSTRQIKPRSLLPFKVPENDAAGMFRDWLHGLWFAPSALKRFADRERIRGVYTPAWTFDADTTSDYTGQRGDDYTVPESYTTTENGQTVTRTRMVTRTRWSYASGVVAHFFDDVLVLASNSLPQKQRDALEPWDLTSLVPYDDQYVAGFTVETYQVDLRAGMEAAKVEMDGTIRELVRRDIGGDHQQISSVDTRYADVTFKHVLLPVWISAYRYRDRTFRFLINARTGEVQGERPYSAMKIASLVVTIVLMILIGILIANSR